MRLESISLSLLNIVVPVLVGCGPPDMCRVNGVVTRNGKPVPFVQIDFLPDDPNVGRPPLAVADKEGRYVMSSGSEDSVIPGNYTITIDDPQRVGGGKTTNDPDFVHVISRYARGKSDLKIEVKGHMDNFQIKLDN